MAKKPDAAVLAFGASGLIPFVKQAKLFGLFEKVPCFAFGLGDSIFVKALKDDMPTGLYAGSNYLWYYPNAEANKAFVEKCKKQFDDPLPSGIGIFGGYTSGKFLTDAILKAGTVETEKVINTLEGHYSDGHRLHQHARLRPPGCDRHVLGQTGKDPAALRRWKIQSRPG